MAKVWLISGARASDGKVAVTEGFEPSIPFQV